MSPASTLIPKGEREREGGKKREREREREESEQKRFSRKAQMGSGQTIFVEKKEK